MKKHKFFDRPILGMLLGMVIALFGIEIIASILGVVFKLFLPNDQLASSLAAILVSVLWIFVHCFWFRNELQHFFEMKDLLPSLFLGWGMILVSFVTLVINLFSGSHLGNVFYALILALGAGLTEEVIFRIVPISIAMRTEDKEKIIPITFVLTGLLFGLIHSANALVGADPVATILQVFYAVAIGFAYAAIYLRTGNLWITIILHTYTDFLAFLVMDIEKTGGLITGESSLSSIVYLLICGIIFYINAFMIFRKEDRSQIPAVWKRIWSKKQ